MEEPIKRDVHGYPAPIFFYQQGPDPSGWKMTFSNGLLTFYPAMGQVPNFFHRLMQWLIFGFKWEKV